MDAQSGSCRTRIKFCGITRAEDAALAVRLGVDAIGLILVPASPRALSTVKAAAIRRTLPPLVSAVVLLRNPSVEQVHEAIKRIRPDLIQFHGEEPAEFCAQFGVPYVKAIAMRDAQQAVAEAIAPYRGAAALMFDGHAVGALGGQGQTFDWSSLPSASLLSQPLMLAGGLTPDNVGAAIAAARPFAVDVSSGIEAAPGVKDSGKMHAFARAVRSADESTFKSGLTTAVTSGDSESSHR